MRLRILLLLSSIIVCQLFGQIDTKTDANLYFKNFPNTPIISQFLKYGDLKVSDFTGTNSIEIPLLNLKEGSIIFPLDLKYISGNGIKVTDEASIVGLGWSIQTPSITQSIMGFDDFGDYIKLRPDYTYSSNPFNGYLPYPYLNSGGSIPLPSGYIKTPVPGQFSFFKSFSMVFPVNGNFTDFNSYFGYNLDTSPDIFTCNIFGEKLEFIVSNFPSLKTDFALNPFVPQFKCLNKKGVKISFDNSNKFKIIDINGTSYFFEISEKTYGGGQLTSVNYLLTKIVDINNNSIVLDYDDIGNVTNLPYYSRKLNYTYATQEELNILIPMSVVNFAYLGPFDDIYPSNSSAYYSKDEVGQIVSPYIPLFSSSQNIYLLKSISGKFGKLEISYSNRLDFPSKKLDSMNLFNSSNDLIKSIDFNYDYFNSYNGQNNIPDSHTFKYSDLPTDRLTKRLKLNSIQINNELYEFVYNNTLFPQKNSFNVDYWGYNNGSNNKTFFLNPNDFDYPIVIPIISGLNDNFKQSSLSYTKAGILEKVIYPTKGYSTFEYELNLADNLFYDFDFSKLVQGAGLRLKKQHNYDFNNELLQQYEFEYYEGFSTNPLSLFKNTSYNHSSILIPESYQNEALASSTYNNIVSMNSTNNNSSSPLASGDYIGYKKVIKKIKDILGNSLGKTEINYSKSKDLYYYFFGNNIPLFLPSVKNNNGEENGKPLSIINYDNTGKVIDSTIYEYKNFISDVDYGVSLSQKTRTVFFNHYVSGENHINYNHENNFGYFTIYSKESKVSKEIYKQFFDDKTLKKVTNYSYNDNRLLNSKEIIFPDNKVSSESINYNENSRFISKNLLSKITDNRVFVNNYEVLHKSIFYDDLVHFNPTSEVLYKIADPNINTLPNIIYDKYDSNGNLLQYTQKSGISTTIIWGYNETQPLAKIEGAKYDDIKNLQVVLDVIAASNADALDSTKEGDLIIALDNFRKNSTMSAYQITTYTYNPLIGVTSITPPNGIREIYKYDIANKLQSVVDVNGKVLKEYQYNYKTPYYNVAKNQIFTRNNCGSGYTGGSYTYTVPAGRYSSITSQLDADNQAQTDINLNGQNTANTNGVCIGSNCSITFNSPLGINGGGGVSYVNSNYRASFGFSSGSNSTNLPWVTTGVKIATINGNCRPKIDYSSSNGQVYYTIKTNGDVILRTNSILPNNTSYNYDFYFPIN